MTRMSLASHPFLLGFEELDRLVEHAARASAESYPPYNIEQRSEDGYRITLAVAGFAENELSITLEDSHLVIRGAQDEHDAREYLHRGIATRKFQRSFVLASRVEVTGATLEHGLLKIDLESRSPETVIRRIEIGDRKLKAKETTHG